jgi:GxxExxY protein
MGVRRVGGLVEEERTHSILGAFFTSYNRLGYGFLESVYVAALERELLKRNHRVAREVAVRIQYDGEDLTWQRLDMLVDESVIVETKTGPLLSPLASRQLDNYLKATTLEVGLLLFYGPRPEFYRRYRAHLGNGPQ